MATWTVATLMADRSESLCHNLVDTWHIPHLREILDIYVSKPYSTCWTHQNKYETVKHKRKSNFHTPKSGSQLDLSLSPRGFVCGEVFSSLLLYAQQ